MTPKPIQTTDSTAAKKPRKERPKPKNWLHGVWLNWIKPIGLAVLVVFAFRWTIADWNDVPSPSMEPTILTGDRIFVNKLSYHLKFPFTHWRIARWSKPERGEIVVFFAHQAIEPGARYLVEQVDAAQRRLRVVHRRNSPFIELERGMTIKLFDPSELSRNDEHILRITEVDQDALAATITLSGDVSAVERGWFLGPAEYRRLVKRIVAASGDTIELRANVMHINGRQVEYITADDDTLRRLDLEISPNDLARTRFQREQLGGIEHNIMLVAEGRPDYMNFGPVTVPEGYYLMMGDNRNRSRDSRDVSLGFIPLEQIVGRSFGVAFSIDRTPTWRIRWNRFFAGFDQQQQKAAE